MGMKHEPLTRKRKAWAEQFKKKVLRGKPLVPNAGLKAWYREELEKMTAEMAAITRRELRELFAGDEPLCPTGDSWAFDESIASQARIRLNRLQARLTALFDTKAKRLAKRMLMKQDRFSKSSLAESLKELSGGLSCKTDFYTDPLRETINASITANVKLITNLKDKYLFQIGEAVQRSIISGKGMGDLLPEIEEIVGKTNGRAKKIALDQTKKTYAAITRHRMAGAGITRFEWLHSGGGQRPRKFHMTRWPNGLNGGIFDMGTPPVTDPRTNHRSFPGEDLGCNCKMIPVIVFEDGEA